MLFVQLYQLTSVLSQRLQTALRRPAKGQGLVEYALIIAVVAIIAVVGLTLLGSRLGTTFSNITESLNLPNVGN